MRGSAAALPSSLPTVGGAAVPRDGAGAGDNAGHMPAAKQKPGELCGNAAAAVVSRRGLESNWFLLR